MALPGDSFDSGADGLVYRASNTAATSGTAGAASKMWLPIWSGEVIHAYDEYNSFEPLVMSKTISSGREMQFPVTGTVDLNSSWDAGEELVGNTNATSGTFKVALDNRPMAAHFEIDNIDLMITQWEFRSELARQAGMTLANTRDKQIYAYLVRASAEPKLTHDPRTSLTLHEGFIDGAYDNLGLSTAGTTDRTTAALAYLQDLEDFVVHLQEENIPTEGVYSVVSPRAFQDIRALGVARAAADAVNAQPMFGGVAQAGGLGVPFKTGLNNLTDSLEYMGVTIMKSNHILSSDSTEIGEAKYNLNFASSEIKAMTWQKSAVAALKLQGLKVDTVDDIRRNTVFTVASMMAGTGVLRPECAVFHTGRTATSHRADMFGALGMTTEYDDA
jgi:hypothetical protein